MADAAGTYLETFEALRRRKRWTTDTTVLRFAALALGSLDVVDPHGRLEATAEQLRQAASWAGPMRSPIRYVVAALILRRGLPVARVHRHVREARDAMKPLRVPRGGLPRTLAALVLVLHHQGRAVPARSLYRMQRILLRWKEAHPWLTGADDLPAAALHATRDEAPDAIALRCEWAYQRLREGGFRRGNPLQLASHLLAFDSRGVEAAAMRFQALAGEFRRLGLRINGTRYDEVAILSLAREAPSPLAEKVRGLHQRLRRARPRPGNEIAFSLASGLALGEDLDAAAGEAARVLHIRAAQAALEAQQAAMIAAIAATSVAVTTSAAH